MSGQGNGILINHKIHLISLSNLDENEIEKYKSDFWHVIKFLTLRGHGKTRKYLEEENGKRTVKHPEELFRATQDPELQEKLMEEYRIK